MSLQVSIDSLADEIYYEHALSRYNSWGLGGTVRRFIEPSSLENLQKHLVSLPADERLIWLGLGSNILFPDGSLDASILRTRKALTSISWGESGQARVEAGVSCAKFSRHAASRGHEAAVFFAGVPGTIGGALAMNAGAFGGETWKYVVKAEVIDRNGKIKFIYPDQVQVGYRRVQMLPGHYFIAGHFQFPAGSQDIAKSRIRDLLAARAKTQPIGLLSCGSVFRNPPGDFAARLIELCGLKGKNVGGAFVSTKHANFIINHKKTASSRDVVRLIDIIKFTVWDQCKIKLIPEVHIYI